jgi:hypothetical protein
MNLVSSFVICVEARTSASLYPARNCAYGLLSACLWFFAAKRDRETKPKTVINTQTSNARHARIEKYCKLTDLGQVLHPAPIPPKILRRRSSKHARIRRSPIRTWRSPRRRRKKRDQRARPVITIIVLVLGATTEGSRGHAFKAEGEGASRGARTHERRGVDERGAARRAVVVHVRDRDPCQAERVERRLPARRGAKDVADVRGLDGVVCDSWVCVACQWGWVTQFAIWG